MFGRKKYVNLFREIQLPHYLTEKEDEVKNKITGYSDSVLANLDKEREIENLVDDLDLEVPSLLKEQTKSSIIIEEMSGQQLPAGTEFVMGRRYNIEVANYTIPFKGNKDFFKCVPSKTYGFKPLEVEIKDNTMVVKLTNWLGGISGNDKVIESLKNELKNYVSAIEDVLELHQNDIVEYVPILKKKIDSVLQPLIEKVNIKNNSSDKLNPF
ncbi:MAG: hypothetical protein CMC96_08015 [Flavobacteriales bacterium]|jgi:predicted RecB family endonuclease|nr:hypothetical protein [Flavobacteriales bacterium]|tara:strand:- start:974 stop:1609 length:636 start_codon:yes stop_codon:yes gene_type:complete